MSNNPFTLMYGKTPSSIIRRDDAYLKIYDTFLSTNPSTMSYIITGVRGSGKTVLLRKLSKDFSNENWIVLDLNPQSNLIEPACEMLYLEGKKNKLYLDWQIDLSIPYLTLSLKKGDSPIKNPEIIFENLVKKATEKGKKILITIDEVNNTNSIKYFANFYQSLIGKDYQIFLLMTGLKDNINSLISDKAASFLSRTPKIELKPLDLRDIAKEYKKLLNIDLDYAIKLSTLTKGYAYAYQVLGYLFYENNPEKINDEFINLYDEYLSKNGYDVIWNNLTQTEKDFLIAMVSSKTYNVNDILNSSKFKESNFNNYRRRLIEKGIIDSPSYGKLTFTLPRFDVFINFLLKFM